MKEYASLIFALIAVFAILYLSYIATKHISMRTASFNQSKYIKIIDKVALSQDRFMAIANIQGDFYLIAVTQQNINLLTKLDEFDERKVLALAKTPSFNSVFSEILNKRKGEGDD